MSVCQKIICAHSYPSMMLKSNAMVMMSILSIWHCSVSHLLDLMTRTTSLSGFFVQKKETLFSSEQISS